MATFRPGGSDQPHLNRRACLRGLSAGFWAVGTGGIGRWASAGNPSEAGAAEASVRARAVAVGLGEFRATYSPHFLVIGDARDTFREAAVKLCEHLAVDYQNTLHAKGFAITLPAERMVVVILGSKHSYAKFNGESLADAEGGFYDVESNRLVIYDHRDVKLRAKANAGASIFNTFTLVHETIHQLTFNGGLFSKTGDVPKVLSEGFATFGELWRETNPVIGQINRPRLQVLADPKHSSDWFSYGTLIAEDRLFDEAETSQMAYAQAWLLIYHLFKTASGVKKLQAYLDRIQLRDNVFKRVGDAEDIFGKLNRLDREVTNSARALING